MARKRTLRPEEEEIWQAVARTAKPMHASGPIFTKHLVTPTHTLPKQAETTPPHPHAQPRLPFFRLGEKARAPQMPDPTAVHTQNSRQMDAKTHAKMTKGRLQPEARIDLHGLTLAEAHPELIRFVLNAHGAGLRLILVITGKGKHREDSGPIPHRMGALRHQVPHWLRMVPLVGAVLQVTEAHLKHGGSGAYYVYLRRH